MIEFTDLGISRLQALHNCQCLCATLNPRRGDQEPALNLRLGAHVLAEGIEQLGGFVGYGLSAYNGGAGLTRRVLAKRRVPFEVWAESNPVKENRGYVKRVMATYGIYRLLYGEEMLRVPDQDGPGAKVHYTPRK